MHFIGNENSFVVNIYDLSPLEPEFKTGYIAMEFKWECAQRKN